MALDLVNSYTGVGKSTMSSFREKMSKLKQEVRETEEKTKKCKEETMAARWREHNAKVQMKAMSERMSEIEEQIRKVETRIDYQNARRKEVAEKSRENFRVRNDLEGSSINLKQMMRDLEEAQQHTLEVKKMNRGLQKVVAILESKIEKAERREQKALDRAFLTSQKLTVHRYLAEKRPEGLPLPDEEMKAPMSDQEAKIMNIRGKIKGAVLRRREFEKKKVALERKMEVMQQAMDNYKRRILDFQVSKRELLSSNFY